MRACRARGGELHGDAAVAELDPDDGRHGRHEEDGDEHGLGRGLGAAVERAQERGRDGGDDVREDEHAHALPDAELVDELAHEHDERLADDEADDDDGAGGHEAERALREVDAHGREQERVADGLGEADGEPEPAAEPDLLEPARLVGVPVLTEGRHRVAYHLDHDLRRDVGHDAEREQRCPREGAAREHVRQRDGAAGERCREVGHGHARQRYVHAEAVDEHEERRDGQLPAHLGRDAAMAPGPVRHLSLPSHDAATTTWHARR